MTVRFGGALAGMLLLSGCLHLLAFGEDAAQPLCTVEIRSLGELSSKLDQAFGGSLPGQARDALKHHFSRLIHAPHLSGVDLEKPVWVLLFDPARSRDPVAVVMELSEPNTFLAELGQYLTPLETEGDVLEFGRVRHEFDLRAYRNASPEQRKDMSSFVSKTTKSTYVTLHQKTAVIAGERTILEAVLGMLPGLSQPERQSGRYQAEAIADVKLGQLARAIAPRAEEAAEALLDLVGWPLPATLKMQGRAEIVASWRNELSLVLAVAQQVQSLEVRMRASAKEVVLSMSLATEPGTELARLLESQRPAKPVIQKSLPPGALGGVWLSFQGLAGLVRSSSEYRARRMALQDAAVSEEQWAALEGSREAVLEQLSGEMAFGVYPEDVQPGMFFASVYGLRNSDAARRRVREALSSNAQFILPMPRGLTIGGELEAASQIHRGVEIDKTGWNLYVDDVPYSDKLFVGAPRVGPAALGWLDGRALAVMGSQCVDVAKRAVDYEHRGGPHLGRSRAWRTARSASPDLINGLIFADLRAYLKLVNDAAAASAGDKPAKLPTFRAVISGWMLVEAGQLKATLRLPMRPFFSALSEK